MTVFHCGTNAYSTQTNFDELQEKKTKITLNTVYAEVPPTSLTCTQTLTRLHTLFSKWL